MAYTKKDLQPYITEYRRLRNECNKARAELVKAEKEVEKAEEVYEKEMTFGGLTIKDADERIYNAKKKVNAVHKKHLLALNKFMVARNNQDSYEQFLKSNRLFTTVWREA